METVFAHFRDDRSPGSIGRKKSLNISQRDTFKSGCSLINFQFFVVNERENGRQCFLGQLSGCAVIHSALVAGCLHELGGSLRVTAACPHGRSLLVFHLWGPVDGNNLCNAISSLSRLIKTHVYKSASNYYTQEHLVPLTNFRQKGLCLLR